MKKLLLFILMNAIMFTLVACDSESGKKVYDVPREGAIILNELPYSGYLSSHNPVMIIEVEGMGEIRLQLFPDVAPNTVNSIISYIQRGDYEDNDFHRVMENFMIQAGKLDEPYCMIKGEMNNNPDYDENNDLKHYRGVISMARVGGYYNSQTSQFFIVHNNSFGLDGEYASFGGVISGFNVLDFIASMQEQDTEQPYERVVIEDISVELNGYSPESPICE